jgi:hypothetical protein
MEHAGTAELAAVLGALGAVVVLAARSRFSLLGGFALLGAGELGLGWAVTGGPRPNDVVGVETVAAGLAGLAVLGVAAAALVRYPTFVTPVVLAAAPFRLPLDVDRRHRFFVGVAEAGQLGRLLPLYAALGAAVAALVVRTVRGEPVAELPRLLAYPAAAFLAYASVSLLWSSDQVAGANLLTFFLLPFAALVAVVARAPFPPWMPRALAGIAVALAALFAVVGLWQAATERLLFYAPNLEVANIYGSFFRVTSLFRDPSLYGRHLVLGISVLLVAVWLRRVHFAAAAALIALLWAGLYFSYSQSSLVALFAVTLGIAAVAGDRRVRILVGAITAGVVVVAGAFLVPEIADESARRVTSDRSRRVELTAKVYRDHPVAGAGIGAQPTESRRLSERFGPTPNFVSHTTPLTVAAELGTIGVLLYLLLLGAAAKLLHEVWRRAPALGLGLGAALLALFVHALFYSGFFEDPLTWLALGVAGSFLATRVVAPEPVVVVERRREPVLTP